MSRSNKSHGLTKDIQNYQIKGSNPYYRGRRIQAEQMDVIRNMENVKLVNIAGKKTECLKNKNKELQLSKYKSIRGI
jgi:hypothetical protein